MTARGRLTAAIVVDTPDLDLRQRSLTAALSALPDGTVPLEWGEDWLMVQLPRGPLGAALSLRETVPWLRAGAVAAGRCSLSQPDRTVCRPRIGVAYTTGGVPAPELLAAARDSAALRTLEPRRVRPVRRRPVRATLLAGYRRVSPRSQIALLVAASTLLAVVVPFGLYSLLWLRFGVDLGPSIWWLLMAVLVVTATSIYMENFESLTVDIPPSEPQRWPTLTAVFAAYLPNEVDTILGSLDAALMQNYPGEFQVVLAYNSPESLPIERILRRRADEDPRLRVLKVEGSRSKAENVNAALEGTDADIVAIFDADHRPAPGSFRRAAQWIAGGECHVVQGHSVIRNGDQGLVARTVAIEYEGIYAVAHPGRSRIHDFGIFGGSNGYWRADMLRDLRMHPWMLTEDIDVSMRAVLGGAKIISDPRLVSRELAPPTLKALWWQRIRWAQGWYQVSRLHLREFWESPHVSVRQRLGATFLLGWREVYPWLAVQMFPLIAYQVGVRHARHLHWTLPLFVFSFLYMTAVGPVQALFAWRLSVPEIRLRRRWFVSYLLLTGAPYGELKNLINRCAHIRQWLGDCNWNVTPRRRAPLFSAPDVLDLSLRDQQPADEGQQHEAGERVST